MIIDAHQHFWAMSRRDYDWLTLDLEPLYRDYLPNDLKPLLTSNHIDGSVVVQAAATEDETSFLLKLAKETPFILGVVGWANMSDKNFPANVARLAEEGKGYLKGIRPMLQDIEDENWVLNTELNNAFATLIKLDLTFDALIRPQHLKSLENRVAKTPQLNFVIDHCAKPDIANNDMTEWKADLARISLHPNVYCKLSGLLTEAKQNKSAKDLQPYFDTVMEHFGPARIMWGSDWPVVKLNGSYQEWLKISNTLTADLSRSEKKAIFGEVAARFYSLNLTEQA